MLHSQQRTADWIQAGHSLRGHRLPFITPLAPRRAVVSDAPELRLSAGSHVCAAVLSSATIVLPTPHPNPTHPGLLSPLQVGPGPRGRGLCGPGLSLRCARGFRRQGLPGNSPVTKAKSRAAAPGKRRRHEYRWCCFVTAPLQRSLPGTGPTQGHGATDGHAFQASEPPGRTEGSVFPPRTFRGSACSGFYQTRVSTLSAWTSGCTF